MGARCGHRLAPGLSWAASPAAMEGGAAAAAAEAAAEVLSEPRASEHEASSHTGACEGRIARRTLSAPTISRAAWLAGAMVAGADAMVYAVCGFAARPSRSDMALGKGSGSGERERMCEKVCADAGFGAWVSARHLDWGDGSWHGWRAHRRR